MFFHPLLRLVADKPHLLLDHAGAYAGLAAVQADAAMKAWRQRLLMTAGAGVCFLLGVTFTGGALLLLAVTPWQGMAMPWLLVAVPGVPYLLAAGLYWRVRQLESTSYWQPLIEQWHADAQLLRDAVSEGEA